MNARPPEPQYGRCEHGHPRQVRAVRCDSCNKHSHTELYCPTCEG